MVLGLSAGISKEKMAHVMDDPLPDGLFPPDEKTFAYLKKQKGILFWTGEEILEWYRSSRR